MDLTQTKHLCRLANAYIFLELYNRDFLKSKSFVLAEDVNVLLNKVMHVVKTSVNHTVVDQGFNEYFGHVSFSRNRLSIQFNIVEGGARGLLLQGMSANIVANAAVGLGDVMRMSLNGYTLVYQFDDLAARLGIGCHRNTAITIDIKAEMDAVINAVMYVPTSLQLLGGITQYVIDKDLQTNLNLLDVYNITRNVNVSRDTGNPLTRLVTNLHNMVTAGYNDALQQHVVRPSEAKRIYLPRCSQWQLDTTLTTELMTEVEEFGRAQGVTIV